MSNFVSYDHYLIRVCQRPAGDPLGRREKPTDYLPTMCCSLIRGIAAFPWGFVAGGGVVAQRHSQALPGRPTIEGFQRTHLDVYTLKLYPMFIRIVIVIG